MLGKGISVTSIEDYEGEHLRICRPRGITRTDSQRVVEYAINQLGAGYNVRQLMDLARFMFPYWFLPKRWRSTLFEHNAGRPTETVCSTMMAEAFAKVRFPIIPVVQQQKDGRLTLTRTQSKLITPRDFDHSPYFDVIKYPILDFDELGIYRKLPWDQTGVHYSNGDVEASSKLGDLTKVKSSLTLTPDESGQSADDAETEQQAAKEKITVKSVSS
jgi:hypothetical protein